MQLKLSHPAALLVFLAGPLLAQAFDCGKIDKAAKECVVVVAATVKNSGAGGTPSLNEPIVTTYNEKCEQQDNKTLSRGDPSGDLKMHAGHTVSVKKLNYYTDNDLNFRFAYGASNWHNVGVSQDKHLTCKCPEQTRAQGPHMPYQPTGDMECYCVFDCSY